MRSKILIADDEPVTRAAVKKVVTRRGWEVVVCDNGHDAAAQFNLENPPDVAVLDWMMPGLDGSELCQRLRKKKVRAYLIMLTGRTRPEDLVQALASGADDYVRKPFDWSELIARIKVGVRVRCCSGSSMRKSVSSRRVSPTRSSWADCCRSAATASGFATTAITGTASSTTSRAIPTPNSRTASARRACATRSARSKPPGSRAPRADATLLSNL